MLESALRSSRENPSGWCGFVYEQCATNVPFLNPPSDSLFGWMQPSMSCADFHVLRRRAL
eukprot:6201664-Pleurochrysis_carterae.AAC.1